MSVLKFSFSDKALQHLSDLAGKRIKVAVERINWQNLSQDDFQYLFFLQTTMAIRKI